MENNVRCRACMVARAVVSCSLAAARSSTANKMLERRRLRNRLCCSSSVGVPFMLFMLVFMLGGWYVEAHPEDRKGQL